MSSWRHTAAAEAAERGELQNAAIKAESLVGMAQGLERSRKIPQALGYYRRAKDLAPQSPAGKLAAGRISELTGPAGSLEVAPSILAFAVVRVIDGDTIVVRKGHEDLAVRLVGVDTPETVHPNKPVEHFGREASAFLKSQLEGRQVYLRSDTVSDSTDRYGRALAHVYRVPDQLWMNREIIRRGYGFTYVQYPFEAMEEFQAAEQEAKGSHSGLWAAR